MRSGVCWCWFSSAFRRWPTKPLRPAINSCPQFSQHNKITALAAHVKTWDEGIFFSGLNEGQDSTDPWSSDSEALQRALAARGPALPHSQALGPHRSPTLRLRLVQWNLPSGASHAKGSPAHAPAPGKSVWAHRRPAKMLIQPRQTDQKNQIITTNKWPYFWCRTDGQSLHRKD